MATKEWLEVLTYPVMDLCSSKVRQALVLAALTRGDVILVPDHQSRGVFEAL